MLLIECPICNRRELRGFSSISRLENTSSGIIATVRCSRGHLHEMATEASSPGRRHQSTRRGQESQRLD